MRPDITLSITPSDEDGVGVEPTLVHFDAKYRVQALEELFGGMSPDVEIQAPQAANVSGAAKRDDLLKMHAYRDAIKRTAGAYVLYPGTPGNSKHYRQFHEILPGLGAFVLRPTEEGLSAGSEAVRNFLDRVLDQAALRFTQHERSGRWLSEVYGTGDAPTANYAVPPDQASVLLGFVKSAEHWRWIEKTRTYNLRAVPRHGGLIKDSALLQSQLLLLYCPSTKALGVYRIVGDAEMVSAEAMASAGYPSPTGAYWCVQIARLGNTTWIDGLNAQSVDEYVRGVAASRGQPTLVTWRVVRSLQGHDG
jgi:hypothetical protein